MSHTPQPQIRPTEYILSKTTILIVDDEAGPRESLKMILSPAHKVLCAESGAEALEILGSREVDVITIDLNMPGMKGEELMRTVRSDYPSTEIIVITGNGSMQTAVEGLRSGICDYISKPFDVVQVSSAVSEALSRRQGRSRLIEFLESVGDVLGMERDASTLLEGLKRSPAARQRLFEAVNGPTKPAVERAESPPAPYSEEDTTLAFLDVLAQALESRDGHLRKHAQRVGFYADLLAERLSVSEEQREHIRTSSFLHDIGKIGLSDRDRERAQLRSSVNGIPEEEHPEIGAKLVQPLGFEEPVADAIRHHHEYWNGDGFPHGLAGEQIPMASRVIAVVDAFDKLVNATDGRSQPLRAEQAVEELQKHAGTRFDPDVVTAFADLVDAGDISEVREFDSETSAAANV